ncbi:MAG: FtsW/RodA/SpoVE family cell cycle protein [Enterocloster bolteae]
MMAARARDLSGRLLVYGMATLVAFQSFANIAVATGIFPNTGLPLPFHQFRKQFSDQYFHRDGAGAERRTSKRQDISNPRRVI